MEIRILERKKKGRERMTFTKQVCRDDSMQTYLEINTAAKIHTSEVVLSGCFTISHKAEILDDDEKISVIITKCNMLG